ncbi:MAG: prepilin-type N-terminal cleavage/methylation domain-containing protein [Methylococcaceae bacterium]
MRHQARGFTLIEVLIAMSLFSMMMLLLFGSLKICADSWEKGENKITNLNELAVVYNFFNQHLSLAKPLLNDFSSEEMTFSFQGKAHALQFVSAMPASAGRSGLQLFSIYLQSDSNSSFINVMLTPFFPLAEGALWHKEEEMLMNHVSDFTLVYFGSEDGISPDSWQDEWLSKDSLPRLVKINIQSENGAVFPEMIIELKIDGKTTANNNNSPETENISNARSD